MKTEVTFYFLIIIYMTKDCTYSPSFKILKARKHKPYLFADYTEYKLSILEELYDKKGNLYKSHNWNIEKKKDFDLTPDKIQYIDSFSVVINQPIYNEHQVVGSKEIWRDIQFFNQKLFTLTDDWYYIKKLPIKFLFRNELCFYNLSLISLVKIEVLETKLNNRKLNQGTLVFYFSFDNSSYLRAYEREFNLLNRKSKLLVDFESKLAEDYQFDDFESFSTIRNLDDE